MTRGYWADSPSPSNVVPPDAVPEAFSFTDETDADLETQYESNAIIVSGIAVAVAMIITGGEYQINGGSWASAATTVVDGSSIKVRGTSSAQAETAVNVVLTIGDVSDTFTITTASEGGGGVQSLHTPTIIDVTSDSLVFWIEADLIEGSVYWVVTESSVAPDSTQLFNGTDENDDPPVFAANYGVTADPEEYNGTGPSLLAATAYWLHAVQLLGDDVTFTNIVTQSFTTDA